MCTEPEGPGQWRVIVDSIGDADAGIVVALRRILPLAEGRIAALLYRAPAELLVGLPEAGARELCGILRSAGLDCRPVDEHHALAAGDGDHEVALVIRDYERMPRVLELVARFLGTDPAAATRLLCATPTVMMSGVSANTVEALRRRLSPLGVELDVSRPTAAVFDVFLGACPAIQRQQVLRALADEGVPLAARSGEPALLAAGLGWAQADRLWARLRRGSIPLRIVNRDFQRFDLRLDRAPDSPEMIEYLQTSTGMPDRIARKVPQRTPLVLQQGVPFAALVDHLQRIAALGGVASGHLLAFQVFGIKLEAFGDRRAATSLLRTIGGLADAQIDRLFIRSHEPQGELTAPQARWLQAELKKVGTDAKLVLR